MPTMAMRSPWWGAVLRRLAGDYCSSMAMEGAMTAPNRCKYSGADFENACFRGPRGCGQDLLSSQWLKTPPKLHGGGVSRPHRELQAGSRPEEAERRGTPPLPAILPRSTDTIIERWFESEKVKAMMAAGITPETTHLSTSPAPACPCSITQSGRSPARRAPGAWSRAAWARSRRRWPPAARSRGVEIKTDAAVASIRVEQGVARGVTLADGTELTSSLVVANTDPANRTFLKLVGAEHLPESFVRDIEVFRQGISLPAHQPRAERPARLRLHPGNT